MACVTIARTINSPAEVVFRTVAEPEQFAKAIVGVTKLEFLSKTTSGVGTCFRQTRVMKGKSHTMDFEVAEYVKNQRVRIVNETHGTTWDSLFTLEPEGNATTLTMRMDAKSEQRMTRLLLPLVCIMVRKAVEGDMDAVRAACEGRVG